MELGYIELEVRDLAAWRRFGEQALGLPFVAEPGGGRLEADGGRQSVRLRAGEADDIARIGFRLPAALPLREAQRRLAETGRPFEVADGADASERRVMGLLRSRDPDGLAVEMFTGAPPAPPRSESGAPGSRRMSDPHLVRVTLAAPRPAATAEFYEGLLRLAAGWPGSDGGDPVRFAAAAQATPGRQRLQALAFEVEAGHDVSLVEAFARAEGLAVSAETRAFQSARALSLRVASPSGFACDYLARGRRELADLETAAAREPTSIPLPWLIG